MTAVNEGRTATLTGLIANVLCKVVHRDGTATPNAGKGYLFQGRCLKNHRFASSSLADEQLAYVAMFGDN